ncbi:MAG: hypothetical protein PHP50_09190 [Lachnospiraceae bacterium]|nr:hypothetical protein [Lachnospiraceae bacterium]
MTEQIKKTPKRRKPRKKAIPLLGVIGIFLLACMILTTNIIYHRLTDFRYEKHLDDIAVSVDGTSVTLRELGYYIYEVEAFGAERAKVYDAEDPLAFWNMHFSAGDNSAFVSELAKDTAYNTCVCDLIYEQMAIAEGYNLAGTGETEAEQSAQEFFDKLSLSQIDSTGLTLEAVTKIEKRRALAKRYATHYLEQSGFDGYEKNPTKELSADGDYYKNWILPEHQVEYNEKIRKNISMGHITINL